MDQQSITLPLLLGIASSLVATAIFICISEAFRKILIPWFSDKVYRGVRIDGEWSSEEGDANFNLKQWGDKISGIYSHGEPGDVTTYNVVGTIKNMYFMAFTEPVSYKVIDAGSLLMHVEYRGGKLILRGSLLYKGSPGEVKAWEGMVFKQ
nr:hypothetical protein [uncultured Pseudomonas sp.]